MNLIWKKYSFIIILFIITLGMGLYFIFNTNSNSDEYVIITVKDGESLWSISEKYAHSLGVSTGEFVKILEKENQLTHKLLKSGEQLMIPTPLNKFDDSERHFVMQTE
ncbi:cell division suppressor protein YneA [Lederbergia lenta]|uniref:Peptidoglycan-binding domain-containing protein n=1 Tax=Lederbergia lenta TaxID=1467 RepID=A0A2X4ZGR8_LEDLE|nr:LysM peptidoglycan-binding domain-containing protein [Lederbergia lenta]MCM3109739.1 LysM peptidoglycan-binding domain-containing protein [Lederbergia lenta]MEC2324510.1 LysM peptidoglycan-binding domain-containing protein [Lederbergia lenta]SQI59654.1 peptidoglycan-binding domain-containing protein [Lederbergia lenta]